MNETLIGIKRPAGGRWTIAPQPGAPPIVVVSHANGLPAARITASVHGHRRARELAYRIRPRAGEAVTFAERAGQVFHVIGTSRRSSGTLRFSPAVAPALRGACASAAAGPSSRPPGVPLPTPMAMP
jgi:hypothetical protein